MLNNARPTRIKIALTGNPNSGKTTIFNFLTGSRQHVGNYPGVTVEKKGGWFRHGGTEIHVADLPGTYALTAFTAEELIARDFLIEQRPDVVVDIVDESNLERSLYLAVQLMELKVPLLLVFNMSDVAKAQGIEVDIARLSELLGIRIVTTVGNRGKGLQELKDAIVAVSAEDTASQMPEVSYGGDIEKELAALASLFDHEQALTERCSARWLALKLLENDGEIRKLIEQETRQSAAILQKADQARGRLEKHLGGEVEIAVADHRYGFISGACQETVKMTVQMRHSQSDRIDAVLLHPALGLPIFLALMYLVFNLTFKVGDPPSQWLGVFFEWVSNTVASFWPQGSASLLRSMVLDGVISGVGGVLELLPFILLLFLAIAILEESGYMARAAFLLDRLMHKIGLHGKSFIPMLIGFGCTVPAIMATRTLETRRDRLTTMLVLPLMSCSARLSIYGLLVPAFFPQAWRAPVLWIIYLTGIVLAIGLIKVLRLTLFKGDISSFVMELPIYRMPTLRSILIHMWQRAWMFLKKAGTVIVAISILLWAMMTYPQLPEDRAQNLSPQQQRSEALAYSAAGRIGHALEPVMRPIGFDWKTNTALLGAFAAKEVFVAQLRIIHAMGESEAMTESEEADDKKAIRTVLQREYTPLQAFSMMLFCLISVPCVVTIVTTWRESGSWKWAALQLVGLTVLAYLVCLVVYQTGLLLNLGTKLLSSLGTG